MSIFSASNRRVAAALIACLATTVACTTSPSEPNRVQVASAQLSAKGPFTFAAAGDHGANSKTALSLAALDRSQAEFYLALGDLDYDQTSSDTAWCEYVKDRLPTKGRAFPFEPIVGNHEEDDGPDGSITNFTDCLPDRLGSQVGPSSVYGAEYSFTYPTQVPLAKFIMIAPNLKVEGERHTYEPGSPHRSWLVRQIRDARESGIQWIVVGAHYPCLTTGVRHGCDSGSGILNLLLRKHVDLVLAGHNHLYERSKQLRLNKSDCRRVRPETYDADCVVDTGGDGIYREGRGAVLLTAGSFGTLEPSENPDDPEARYFAKSHVTSTGFEQLTVSRTRIKGTFVRTTGTLRDSFEIVVP